MGGEIFGLLAVMAVAAIGYGWVRSHNSPDFVLE